MCGLIKLVLIVVLAVVLVPAKVWPHDSYAECHEAIINLELDKADKMIAQMPDSYCKFWLSAYALFVRQLSSLEKPQPEAFAEFLKNVRQYDNGSPDYLQCLSDIYLMKCYAHFVNDSYIAAYAAYISARQTISSVSSDDWKRQRFRLIELIMDNQMQNVVPLFADNLTSAERTEQYCIVVDKLTSQTTIPEQFRREIEISSLLLFPLASSDNNAALRLMQCFGYQWRTSSPIAAYVAAERLVAADSMVQALKILTSACESGFANRLNLLNLRIGSALLNAGNDSCEFYLRQFIDNQRNPSNVLYAKFKLAWYLYLKGDGAESEVLCQKVMQSVAITPSDAQAKYECAMHHYWDTLLLRARLAFDAADYQRCKKILGVAGQQKSRFSPIQTNEYNYRMGRVCHKTGDFENAKRYYEVAIDRSLEKTLYYPCYSAYYIGLIYKQEGDKSRADEYFKLCRKIGSPIYGESIHQKASRAME
jgi:hypothetical protein